MGPNDLSVDPLFAGPADRDYSLTASSPCVDAGHPDAAYNDPDGSRNDLGAIPYEAPQYICGDANADGLANVGDVVYLINYIFYAGPGPEPDEAGDVNGDGTVNVGDAVYLINNIFNGGPDPACL